MPPIRSMRPLALLLLAFVAAWTTAAADKVYLRTGRIVEGKVVSETGDFVLLRMTNGAQLTLKRDDILRIDREEGVSPEESDADAAFTGEKYDNALPLYEKALAQATDPTVRQRLEEKVALTRERIRQRDEAMVEAHLERFEELLEAREFDKAEILLDELLAQFRGQEIFEAGVRQARARIHYAKARRALDSVNAPLAEREAARALELSPGMYEAHLLLAEINYDRSQWDQSLAYYQRARELAEASAQQAEIDRIDFRLAAILFQLGRYTDALPLFARLRRDAPDRFPTAVDREIDCLERMGDRFALLDQKEQAIEMYARAIESNPVHRSIRSLRRKIGELYLNKFPAEPDKALEQFNHLKREPFAIAELHFLIARCHIVKGEPEEAIVALEMEIAVNPSNYQAYIALSNLYIDSGQYSKADKTLDSAIQILPDSYQAFLIQGKLRRLQERYDEAKTLLNQVIAKEPDVIEASLLLGLVYLEEDDFIRSAQLFDHVIGEFESKTTPTLEQTETLIQAYNARGSVDLERQEIRLGLDRFEKARSLNPNYAETYSKIGEGQKRLQNFADAEAMFRKAIALNPRNPDYQLALGLLYHNNLEDKEKAIEFYNRYFDLGGQDYNSVNKWLEELGAPRRTPTIQQ